MTIYWWIAFYVLGLPLAVGFCVMAARLRGMERASDHDPERWSRDASDYLRMIRRNRRQGDA